MAHPQRIHTASPHGLTSTVTPRRAMLPATTFHPVGTQPSRYSADLHLGHVGDGWIDSTTKSTDRTRDLLANDDDSDLFAAIDSAVTHSEPPFPEPMWGPAGLQAPCSNASPAVAFPIIPFQLSPTVTSPVDLLPHAARERTNSSLSTASTSTLHSRSSSSSHSSSAASAFSFSSSATSSSTSSYPRTPVTPTGWDNDRSRFIPAISRGFSYAAAAGGRRTMSVPTKPKLPIPVEFTQHSSEHIYSAVPRPAENFYATPPYAASPSPNTTPTRPRRSGVFRTPPINAAAAALEAREIRRFDREQHGRVHIDASKNDVVPYDGGKTTVLTGGVMLGTTTIRARPNSDGELLRF